MNWNLRSDGFPSQGLSLISALLITAISTTCWAEDALPAPTSSNTVAAASSPAPAADIHWNEIPQSGLITLNVKGKPVKEVIEEVSKQAGFLVEWGGDSKATVDVSVDKASLMETLASICRQGNWGMMEYQSARGSLFQLPEEFPIKQYQAKGPVLLAWHDFATITNVFKDVSSKYRLNLIIDPQSHIETSMEESVRDEPITFILEDGKRVTLKSDHDRSKFTSGDCKWMFDAGKGLTGKKITIEASIPAIVPTRMGTAVLPWKSSSSGAAGDVNVFLETVKMETAQESNHDVHSKDFMKKHDIHEFSANFKVAHSAAAVFEKLQKENRQPTGEEAEKLKIFPEGGVLAPHAAVLIGEDGTRIPGLVESPDGMSSSSPYQGYPKKAVFKVDDLKFTPKEIQLSWAEGFRRVTIPFKMENVPLTPK